MVKSVVGDFLEHARIYYFHQAGNPKVYGGSADIMVRSFDRRLESLFLFLDKTIRKEVINILHYNLKDNVNSYLMQEDGKYFKVVPEEDKTAFNLHQEFYNVKVEDIQEVSLFEEELQKAGA